MYPTLLISGIVVCVIALVVTVIVGINQEDRRFAFSKSFRNLGVIYLILFTVLGLASLWIIKVYG